MDVYVTRLRSNYTTTNVHAATSSLCFATDGVFTRRMDLRCRSSWFIVVVPHIRDHQNQNYRSSTETREPGLCLFSNSRLRFTTRASVMLNVNITTVRVWLSKFKTIWEKLYSTLAYKHLLWMNNPEAWHRKNCFNRLLLISYKATVI
jgi:hypothetical protein